MSAAISRKFAIDPTPLRTSPAFRTLFLARTISVFGIGFLVVALPIQVYQLTGSTAQVATVATVIGISAFAGTLVGGTAADHYDRRTVIVASRAAATVGFALLAVNAMLPEPRLWLIFVCAVIDGLTGGISETALVAAMPNLIAPDKLAAGAALMALTADLGSMAAPALAGLLIAWLGVAANFWLAAGASLVTTVLIARLGPMIAERGHTESPVRAVLSGFRFVVGHRIVGATLLVGCVTMLMSGWTVLVPEYVSEVLHGGETTAGLLFAAPAVGAVLGSLTSGWTGSIRRGGQVIFAATLVCAAGILGAGLVGVTAVVFAGLAAHGAGRVVSDIARFAVVQADTPDEFRGRVSGLWTAQLTIALSLGAVVAGVVSSAVPTRAVFLVYGAGGCVLTVVAWCSLGTLRRLDTARR
ncbi:enterobactin transporter EntS [Nocardia sp. PE-7]|uniref:enterobactin transporter EntS n=1 Tax=Nocardia sp. PE-7 TaxID=3058426 RepID=UPI0026591F32|nr:enterobactin transporter EntS [Nocardia sp. PE-7]WKG08364.1 enterobactin transporter EntS [Nocardia sp. PE-7]